MFESLIQSDTLLASVAIFAAVVCAVYGVAGLVARDERWSRLAPASGTTISARKGGSRLELMASRSLGSRLAPTDARERADLKLWLVRAGYDSPLAVQAYYGSRFILGAALAAAAAFLVPVIFPHSYSVRTMISAALGGGVIGFMFPVLWMSRKKSTRERHIREGLPHVIDLLLICTEAGLGLDMAIARVGEQFAATQPILSEQLDLISAELRAGRPRSDAFRGFAQRTGVPEVISLVNLLVQSDTLGTSMAGTLRVVSQDMREHQILRVEALAQKVSSKLSLVLVGCFLPALITAIIAPIIFRIVSTWPGISF
jgi:tight adherence protein C